MIMLPTGRTFYKMSGSGNDFVVVDATREPADELMVPATVQAICARATGIGADGLVLLQPSRQSDFRMTYLNSDGSSADLCGNASLCAANLSEADLGMANLTGASLRVALLANVNLNQADLSGADLTQAYLGSANLSKANLSGANLTNACLFNAMMVECVLDGTVLKGASVYGVSAWGLDLSKVGDQTSLVITPNGHAGLTVDNLELAQFVYLMVHNEKIRGIIDTIGRKAVLILGRFQPALAECSSRPSRRPRRSATCWPEERRFP